MNMKILKPKLDNHLLEWTIIKIGIIDKYRYLVMANWSDEKKPHVAKNGKKYKNPTKMICIDLSDDTVWWRTALGGFGHGYCDGGIINGNAQAFFSSYEGITFHLDYEADTFGHEEVLLSPKRVEEGTGRGVNDIKVIGNHFYTVGSGNKVYRRDKAKEWTDISKEPREYFKKLGNGNAQSLSAFNEKEIYFCGDEGNLWWYDGKKWEKIFNVLPKDKEFTYIECCDDGKVYVVDSTGGVAVGRHDKFTYYPIKTNIGEIIFDVTHFNGKLYMTDYNIYEFKNDHWVKAKIPGVYGRVAHLAAKDGVLFIGTTYSLKIYNSKETYTLYGEAKEDAMLVTKALLETSGELLEKGHDFLDELAGQKKN